MKVNLYYFKKAAVTLLFAFVAIGVVAEEPDTRKNGKLEPISLWWKFIPVKPACGTLSHEKPYSTFKADGIRSDGFGVRFSVDLSETGKEKTLLEIPGVMDVQLHLADPAKRDRQNYPAFKMPDGSVPVIEVALWLHAPTEKPFKQQMVIGFPLAMLPKVEGKHEVIINFTGAKWTMYVDGMIVDNEFPIGYPAWGQENKWSINTGCVSAAEIFFPAFMTKRDSGKIQSSRPNIQYWTPAGHNSWVGDVATLFYKGRYHVFYLYDRRHHASKFGCGGHYFEHLSTTDFINWTEHEAATPIEAQWETFGTGTPFVFNDKLCISYGLHSSRIYPDEKTMYAEEIEYFKEHGVTGSFTTNPEKAIPSGATYSISRDGVSDFQKTGILFHHCENPSIYTDPDGKLRMLANYRAKGMWESDSVNGGWHCINENFPPGGDCTFFFRWGAYDYIIGGFTGLWNKPAGAADSAWQSMVEKGNDFYNGMNVPAITEITGGRFLMAGWLPLRGWGGPLVIHEMIQLLDGRIGTKWMNELTPETLQSVELAKKINQPVSFDINEKSYILTFDVFPGKAGKGKLALSFLPSQGETKGCEFQIDLNKGRAQYSNAVPGSFAKEEKSLREGGAPQNVTNYAIENLLATGKSFSVRIAIKANDKFGATLFDAEVAGKRTLISLRPDLEVKNLSVNIDGVEIRNLRMALMAEN